MNTTYQRVYDRSRVDQLKSCLCTTGFLSVFVAITVFVMSMGYTKSVESDTKTMVSQGRVSGRQNVAFDINITGTIPVVCNLDTQRTANAASVDVQNVNVEFTGELQSVCSSAVQTRRGLSASTNDTVSGTVRITVIAAKLAFTDRLPDPGFI